MSNDYFNNPYAKTTLLDGVTASASLWNTERSAVENMAEAVEDGFDILPDAHDPTGVEKGFDDPIYVGSGTEDGQALRKSQVIAEIAAAAIGGGDIDAILQWTRKSTTYTAAVYDWVLADTSSAAWTLSLPASPSDGNQVWVLDGGGTFNDNNLTISGNGKNIDGAATFTASQIYQYLIFVFHSGDDEWKVAWKTMSGIFRSHSEELNAMTAIDAVDVDAVCISQSGPGGGGSLTIDGAKASGGTATFSQGRLITIDSAGNDSGITFTVSGTNAETGAADNEAVTGANAGQATSTKYFSTVTSVVTSGSTASTVEVGQGSGLMTVDMSYGYATITIAANVGKVAISNSPATGNYASCVVEVTNGGGFTWPSAQANTKSGRGISFGSLFSTSSGVDIATCWTTDAGTTQNWANPHVDHKAMT